MLIGTSLGKLTNHCIIPLYQPQFVCSCMQQYNQVQDCCFHFLFETFTLLSVDNGEHDNEEDKKNCEEQCQEIFAVCNDKDVRQRLEKEENDADYICEQHDSYELKWDGERDSEEKKKKVKDQHRESFDFRNTEDIRQRLEREDKDANDLCESMIAMI